MDYPEGLKLPDSDSIPMCCCFPPYRALRDYGVPDKIGQEDKPIE
jgi:hypothetical protein